MESFTSDIMMDCAPLTQSCIKALIDKVEEKRKLAASEIEKMTVEFGLNNNLSGINKLIIFLGRKFCLSPNPNIRKGGLMGLAAVAVGYRNGSDTKLPPETIEEIIRPILTCFLDSDARVRYYACESLYNVTKVIKEDVIPLMECIFDNMCRIVADPDIGVRTGAELLDRLLKDIIVEQKTLDIQAFLPKLEEYIYTRNPFTRMFIISWIRLLDTKIDMVNHLPVLLDGIYNCLNDPTGEIRAAALSLLSEFLNKAEEDSTNLQEKNENIRRFIQALCKMFQDSESVFEERGTFIIINICSIIKPEVVYRTFAEIIKDGKMEPKLAFNLVQKLNQILLTSQALVELRSRLSNDEDPKMTALFLSLYYAWCYSPIAALTLCLLTNNYRHASEIVTALAKSDINIDILTQIDWTVQLIELPIFASLRMRLLDVNNNQYLLQSLYGLLMILPQSEAYRKLGHRLDQAYKFMSVQPQFKAIAPQPTSQVSHKQVGKDSKKASNVSLEALMKHYFNIQNQLHETTRRPC